MTNYILFDSPCPDGFYGAYAAAKGLRNETNEFIGVHASRLKARIDGLLAEVKEDAPRFYFIDETPDVEDIQRLLGRFPNADLIILDHHASNIAKLQDFENPRVCKEFDSTRCAAQIAHRYFCPGVAEPEVIRIIGQIEDNALNTKMDFAKAAIIDQSLSDFFAAPELVFDELYEKLDKLAKEPLASLVAAGMALVEAQISNFKKAFFNKHLLEVCNPKTEESLGYFMAVNTDIQQGRYFAELMRQKAALTPNGILLVYKLDNKNGVLISLRSADDDINCAPVAEALTALARQNLPDVLADDIENQSDCETVVGRLTKCTLGGGHKTASFANIPKEVFDTMLVQVRPAAKALNGHPVTEKKFTKEAEPIGYFKGKPAVIFYMQNSATGALCFEAAVKGLGCDESKHYLPVDLNSPDLDLSKIVRNLGLTQAARIFFVGHLPSAAVISELAMHEKVDRITLVGEEGRFPYADRLSNDALNKITVHAGDAKTNISGICWEFFAKDLQRPPHSVKLADLLSKPQSSMNPNDYRELSLIDSIPLETAEDTGNFLDKVHQPDFFASAVRQDTNVKQQLAIAAETLRSVIYIAVNYDGKKVLIPCVNAPLRAGRLIANHMLEALMAFSPNGIAGMFSIVPTKDGNVRTVISLRAVGECTHLLGLRRHLDQHADINVAGTDVGIRISLLNSQFASGNSPVSISPVKDNYRNLLTALNGAMPKPSSQRPETAMVR